jgi:hypothetical protein
VTPVPAACRAALQQHVPSTVARQVVFHASEAVALPFADAAAPLDRESRGKLICAGANLLRDPAFETLLAWAAGLGTPVHADSHFAFRAAGLDPERGTPRALPASAYAAPTEGQA